jgi:predicted PurR-regulated permease PerM
MLKVEISYQGLIILILVLLGVWAFLELWPVILLVLISVILMLGLLPYVDALMRLGLKRPAAVLVLLALVFAIVIGLFSLMIPAIIEELSNVQENLPQSARELEELADSFGIKIELQEQAESFRWEDLFPARAAVDYGQRVLTTTLSVITIIVMTAYLLADTPRLAGFVNNFIPAGRKEDADRLFVSMSRVVGGYLRGQMITSLSIGLFTFVLLRIVGVPNPLAFAVLAGFADIVPLVGAFLATLPPVVTALEESSTKALIVLVAMMAYQQFEDRILVPRVYGRTLNLPPIIVLIAVLAGAEVLGITGVLLALPLTAAGRVIVDYVIENRRGFMPATAPSAQPDQPLAPDPKAGDVLFAEDHSEPALASEPEAADGEAVELRSD